jgi:hypothetical protein
MTLEQAKAIARYPNKHAFTPDQLREAAAILSDAGWHTSADNIHIHLCLRQ